MGAASSCLRWYDSIDFSFKRTSGCRLTSLPPALHPPARPAPQSWAETDRVGLLVGLSGAIATLATPTPPVSWSYADEDLNASVAKLAAALQG